MTAPFMTTSTLQDAASEPLSAEIADAVGAFFCRFGDPEREARRRGTLRSALRSSRALSRALEEFTRKAYCHYQGVHCASQMDADVDALTRAFTDWADDVRETASLHRQCRDLLGGPGA